MRKNIHAYVLPRGVEEHTKVQTKGDDLYIHTGDTPNLHSLWLLNSATRTLQWGEWSARWARGWWGRKSEGGCMMPDAEMQRNHCNVVVRCRRTAENSVDLPKGSETLLIFHVRSSALFIPCLTHAFTPFTILFHLYARAWQKGYRLSRKYSLFWNANGELCKNKLYAVP